MIGGHSPAAYRRTIQAGNGWHDWDPQQKLVGELLAALPCLPLDESAADRAADIRRSLERDGPFPLQGRQKNVLSAPVTVKASSTR